MQAHVEQFLAHMASERGMSANTTAAYRTDLDQLCAFLRDQAVSDWTAVSHDHVLGFMIFLRERRYANSTVARRTAAVKSFFSYLLGQQLIASDPTEQIDSPKVDRFPPKAISPHQVDELLELPLRSSTPEGLRDLHEASGVRARIRVGAGRQDVRCLPVAEVACCLRLDDVVDPGRTAADVLLGRLDDPQAGDPAEERQPGRREPLCMSQVAGVLVGDGQVVDFQDGLHVTPCLNDECRMTNVERMTKHE